MTEALIGGSIGLALVAGIWFGLNRLSGKRLHTSDTGKSVLARVWGWAQDEREFVVIGSFIALVLVGALWLAHADAEAHKGQHCVAQTTTYVPIKAGSVTIMSPVTSCSQWAPNAPAAN